MNKDSRKINIIKDIGIFILIAIISFVFLLKSPLNIWSLGDSGTDSSVFRMIATMMKNGYMPYRDSFDHKGPLLYIINYVGLIINENHGVWFIELIFMIFTCLGIYRISRLSCDRFISIIVLLVCLNPLFYFFGGGNKAEEYAMTFIAWGLYIFLDYFTNKNISKIRLIICGLFCGAVLMMQPNMASMWVVFCIAVLIYSIKNNNIKEIPGFLLYFCIGLAIIIIPLVIWLAVNNALKDCIDAYIGFNALYTSFRDGGISISDQWAVTLTFLNEPAIIIAFICTVLLCVYRRKLIYFIYAVYILAALWIASISGFFYEHYFMIMVPAIAFPVSEVFKIFKERKDDNVLLIATAIVAMYFAVPSWIDLAAWVPGKYNMRNSDSHSEIVMQVSDIIRENTDEDDRIAVYGNFDMFYLQSGRLHATRFSFTAPVLSIAEELEKEYFTDLKEELPKCIVVQMECTDSKIDKFIEENNYMQIDYLVSDAGDQIAIYIKQ